MKLNKFILVSMIMLAIIFIGAVSAAEDLNTTADTLSVETGGLELSSPVVDKMDTGGEIDDADVGSAAHVATGTYVKSVENSNEKLSASDDKDALCDDYEILTPEVFLEHGFNDRVMTGNYKMQGTFTSDEFPQFIFFDEGCVIDASEAEFHDIGIILEGGVQITGLTLTSSQYLEDQDNQMSPGAIVYVKGDNVILDGLAVNYAPTAEGDAYGIYVTQANNFKLLNSNITFTGSSLEEYYEYAMRIDQSSGVTIRGNTITANLPILDVDYNKGEPGLDTDLVLNTGIRSVDGLDIIDNTFIANVVDRNGDFPTLDCVMMEYCDNVNVIGNRFNETDFITNEGDANYLNVLDMYYSDNVLVQGNNISVETTGGTDNAGTSYPIQLTGPYEGVVIDGNDLYAHCGGPALGIYSQNYYGDTEITVQNNNIDITGLPTDHSWGLVSGIELQDNVARVYNNTITTKSVTGSFEEGMNLYGISYAQALMDGHNYEIIGNTIVTEGQYAIYLLQAQDTTISGNYLVSSAGEGDDTVYIREADGNTVIEDNHGAKEEPETFYGVVTAETFFDFFKRSGELKDDIPAGATLDFQGEFISTSSTSYAMEINKPVNIISTTKDVYIDLDATSSNRFTVSFNGSGSNISDLSFYNTQIWIYGAHNLIINNMTSIARGKDLGSGVGVVAFRGGSSHIKVKNSYFLTENNGGHSNFVLTNASYVSVDNSSIIGQGNVGNLIYLNVYNLETMPEGWFLPQLIQAINKGQMTLNDHNNFTNCYIKGPDNALAICYIFTNMGSGFNRFENNTVVYGGSGINSFGNDGVISGNTFIGCGIVSPGSRTQVIDNNITGGTITASGSNLITGNTVNTTENYAIILGKTKDNTIYDNYLESNGKKGDAAVDLGTGTGNVVENNGPFDVEIDLAIEKDNVVLPDTNAVTVTVVNGEGTVEIKVNGRVIATPALQDGSVTQSISAEDIVVGENTVEVTYNGITNSTIFYAQENIITPDNIVTKDNFYEFFDDEGNLLDTVEFDELIFQGEFEGLVDHITIERSLSIVGDEATLYNMGFVIQGDDCKLDNLKLIADEPLGALILVDGAYGATLSNLSITYDGGDEAAVAIEVEGDGIQVVNNTIFFESHVPDDEEFAVGLKLTGCTNALVDGNNITTKLPCVYVNNYDDDYYMMGSDKVDPVRIKDCTNLVFTNNFINSTTNDYSAEFPTIQAIQILGCKDSILDHNNISMIDEMTPAGMDNYLYGINFGYNTNVTFSNNNFNMSTSGGKDAAGTAYAFQGVESEVIIKGNNITSISNGPNLGIYVASMFGGDSDLVITDNFINVTGYASSTGSWALVSGIEIQNGDAKIYNNTIYTYNVNEYDEYAYMYGISYAQWMYGDRSFDIQDNEVHTEGKYTISIINATSLNAERNILYAHDLSGDDSINAGLCEDVHMGDNLPESVYTGIIYVSETGNDNNTGSIDKPVATIAHAVELANAGSGKIIITEGTYQESNIELDTAKAISIAGEGNVIIDGNAASDSIFVMHGGEANFTNLKFTNAKPNYGGAIFMNYGTGTSRDIISINVIVDNCTFDGLATSKRGGAIYALYTEGNLIISNSRFYNMEVSAWGGAVCAGYSSDGLNVEIENCIFENNTANNGGGAYLQAKTISIKDSTFNNNSASYDSGAIYLYDSTAAIDNCIITNNKGGSEGVAIKFTRPTSGNPAVKTLTITNSVIENNSATSGTLPAIYVDMETLDISYCSIVNDLSIQTRTASSYDAVYGQGIAIADNNWWGTNDPTTKVTGQNITIEKWVIMNVEPSASEVNAGDEVTITVDFNHVNTTAGEIEELTGGDIPKESYDVILAAVNGTISPDAITVLKGESKEATFTAGDANALITATCGEAVANIEFVGPTAEPYYGIIYVDQANGDDLANNGSQSAPVATIAKAVELALIEGGFGQIIVNAGTYVGSDYHVTGDLTVTGVGEVTLDANNGGRLFYMGSEDAANKIELSNLVLTNAKGFGAAVYSFANELILDNVTIINNNADRYLIRSYGKLTIKDSEIANSMTGNVIEQASSGDILINNTVFKDNSIVDGTDSYGVIYLSSGSGNLVIEDSKFINNTARQGVIKGNGDYNINVKGTEFIDNTNTVSYGGAIYAYGPTLDVTGSTFINNKASKDGGAIYVGWRTTANVIKSTFIDNTAGTTYHGDAIYNGNILSANYCVFLTNADHSIIFNDGEDNVVNAQYNWWGTNDDPKALNGVGTYEDDDDWEVNCAEVDSSKWVFMNVTTNMTGDSMNVGDKVEITVDFTNYLDSTNALRPLPDSIPEITVSAGKVSRSLDATEVTTVNGIAKFVYTADVPGEYAIRVVSADAVVEIPITVNGEVIDEGIVYVDGANGADTNDGKTRDTAVKTIEHAVEIATGQIVLLEGIHKTNGLGIISNDLNITGEGNAVIDAQNNNRILYVGEDAKVVISNVVMINGYTVDESGALLGSSNELTLINCTLANSSAGENNGGAIFSIGKLTIINTTFANCTAVRGGAIYTQSERENTRVDIFNSTFENNIAKGKETWGGGAIYAQRVVAIYGFTMTIDNTTFKDNEAQGTSSGGAIQIEQLVSTVKITNSEFISNHANGKDGYGGGAISTSSPSTYERQGTMTITGSLFENNTCDANGGAIYARTTTVKVENSVLINNTDSNGLAVYGYKSQTTSPAITLNDNWWGANDSPKGLVGGNGYKPTLNRWAILTATNASEIREGETVQITVSINNYTDGTATGALSKPITVKRDVTISTTFGDIEGVLENGEFVYNLAVPSGLKYIAANVDGETVVLYVSTTNVTVAIDDITAKKFEKVEVTVTVTSEDGAEINVGNIELYIGDDLIATIPVSENKAIKEILFTKDEGIYNLTAKYVEETGLFGANQTNATLTVAGIVELTNDTFFNFFDEDGILRSEFDADELVFHGDFSGLGVDIITIPRSVAISGDNAILYDMAISLEAANSKVSGMTFISDGTDFAMNKGAVILVSAENIELNNVSVIYTAPRTADAYAVYAYEATGFKLIDSTIVFDSDNAGAIHHAVHIVNSDDINVTGNTVNASLPAKDVNWHWTAPFFDSIDQESVLAIGIQGGSNGVLTQNEVNVKTKSAAGYAPTIDSIIVYGVNDFEISWNNITHVDTVNAGEAGYSNAIDLYAFDGVTVKYNNVLVNSTAGAGAKGTAYPIQATGPYTNLVIDHNNLTSISNGPALGIYSQNYDGITDIVVINNNINATGIATENVQALVSGMELQDTNAKVYNNTIYSQSKGSYDDFNALYGISYSQYTEGNHTFDIKDNNVFTDGKFAVYLLKAKNSNVTGNTLYAHELMGDKAVNVSSGEGNVVKDNSPVDSTLTIEVKDITVGETAVINIKLDADLDGIANVIVDGKEYSVNITSGIGQVNVTDLAASDYTVSAKFTSSNIDYGGGENSTVFTVAKLESDINITISGAELGNNATIAVSIPGATGNVTVIVNGKEEEIPLDENGTAAYTIDDIAADDYNVVVIYSGDKDHAFAYAAESFTVDKLASEVNVTVVAAKAGDKSVIKVNVTDGATGTVVIDVNGTKYAIDLADGNELEVALDAGSYAVVAAYSGDDNYNASVSKEETLVVENKLPANIQIEVPDDAKVGETVTINITADTDVKLVVLINGEAQEIPAGPTGMSMNNILKAGNSIQLTYKVLKAGIYNVTVSAEETPDYAAQTVTKVFEATKKDAELNITPITDAQIGDKVNIAVEYNTDGALTIKVNGETVTGEYEITKAGSYTVVVESAATDAYNKGFATYTFEVAEPSEYNITVNVDGKDYNATVVNGTATVDTDMDDLIDNLTAELNETKELVDNLTGELAAANAKVDNLTAELNETKELVDNLTGELAAANAKVDNLTAELNETKELVDNLTGELAAANAKVDNLTAELNETKELVDNLTADLAEAQANATSLAKDLADANKVIEDLTKQLEDALARIPKSAVVDGVEYPIEYVNGTATITTNKTEPDNNITVIVDGKEYPAEVVNGTAVVNTDPVAPAPVAPSVNVTVPTKVAAGEAPTVKVELPSDAAGNVTVKVDGKEVANVPVTNGTADIPLSALGGGSHAVEVAYTGDSKYAATTAVSVINAEKKATHIEIDARFTRVATDFNAGERGANQTGRLLDEDGNPVVNRTVQIAVNGVIYNKTTDENGTFYHQINLAAANTYTYALVFSGDELYNASLIASSKLTVTKKATSITASNKAFKAKAKTKTISVTLKTIKNPYDGKTYLKSGKKITLKVNGVTYTAKINAKGVAKFTIKLTKKGKYTATVKFAGDKTYKASSKKIKITIK